ncbi:MAG: glycosyltransferase family 2 protein [Candidatus Thermoplasmatota archaeon]
MSVIVSTRDRKDVLRRTLQAYRGQSHRAIEVLVVDNCSTDGTAEMLAGEFPEVRFVPTGWNGGYARSMNLGVRHAKGDVFLFTPDDVVPDPAYVVGLVDALADEGVGAASGVLTEWPDTSRINFAGASISPLLRLRFERSRLPTTDEVMDVGIVPGLMAVRRAAFEAVGGFDGDFATYFEDADLSLRLRGAGLRTVLAPRARARHVTHPLGTSYYREFFSRRNVVIFYAKHAPNSIVLGAFLGYTLGWAMPRDLIRALVRRDPQLAHATLAGNVWWIVHPRFLVRKRREMLKTRASSRGR